LLVPEERADVERFLVGGHALPLCSIEVGFGASRHSERSEETGGEGSPHQVPQRAAQATRSLATLGMTAGGHSLLHRCAIGICRPLPNALVDTRMVGA